MWMSTGGGSLVEVMLTQVDRREGSKTLIFCGPQRILQMSSYNKTACVLEICKTVLSSGLFVK